MDFSKQSPVSISFCTGLRGLEKGFERACRRIGWQQPNIAAYVEIEAFADYNLVKKMEQGLLVPAPIWTDIKTFPAASFYRKIHGVFGGYPCTPFSTAGRRNGAGYPGHLWPDFERCIQAIQPIFCGFENVDDHLTLGFDEVYRSLSDMGYAVEAGVYTAEEAGAPHERKRLFIVAIKMDNAVSRRHGVAPVEIRTGRHAPFISNKKLGHAPLPMLQRGGPWYQARLNESSNSNKKLAYDFGTGYSQKYNHSEIEQGNTDRWPAPPGQAQFEWEAPHVKSSVDFTINGYNFREDLLRLAGNAVVEQQAEIAFLDLLKKFNIPCQ